MRLTRGASEWERIVAELYEFDGMNPNTRMIASAIRSRLVRKPMRDVIKVSVTLGEQRAIEAAETRLAERSNAR